MDGLLVDELFVDELLVDDLFVAECILFCFFSDSDNRIFFLPFLKKKNVFLFFLCFVLLIDFLFIPFHFSLFHFLICIIRYCLFPFLLKR